MVDGHYLHDTEGVEALALMDPDNAWANLFRAAAALKMGDLEIAAAEMLAASSKTLPDSQRSIELSAHDFLIQERGLSIKEADKMIRESPVLNDVGVSTFMRKLLVETLVQAESDPALAVSGLALADAWSEQPGLRISSAWQASARYRDFLRLLGSDADRFLTVPYAEALATVEIDVETLGKSMGQYNEFREQLDAQGLTQLINLTSEMSEDQAMRQILDELEPKL